MFRSIQWRQGFVWALAVACGLFVAWQFQSVGASASVVVAARSLNAHQRISAGDLRLVSWPRRVLQATMVREPASAAGRYLLQPVAAGQPLERGMLSADAAAGGVRGALPAGRDAVALPVKDPGRLPPIKVGDRIDVVYVQPTRVGLGLARVLSRGLPVVGLGRSDASLGRQGELQSIIVAAGPSEAERLAYAMVNGTLIIGLEGYEPSDAVTAGVTAGTLFDLPSGTVPTDTPEDAASAATGADAPWSAGEAHDH